jgi:ABC-type polar amino acid transport system ATPase subunit
VVCGPSGSGKSTLIKTVNGLEPVQQGSIHVDGVSQCGEMNEYASENGKIVGDSEDISWLSGGANLTTHFSD